MEKNQIVVGFYDKQSHEVTIAGGIYSIGFKISLHPVCREYFYLLDFLDGEKIQFFKKTKSEINNQYVGAFRTYGLVPIILWKRIR